MKLNDYFEIQEFVPPQTFKRFGANSIWFINPKIVELATAYREFFKLPVVINNWNRGGQFSYRGYRPPRVNVGAEYSQHKLGNAFDCNIGSMTEKQMFDAVKENFSFFKEFGLTTLEDYNFTDGWLHSDVRHTNLNELLIVKPL